MTLSILHIESSPELAEAVALSFQSFGFSGKTLRAATVREAGEVLERLTRSGEVIDLIISDMSLPDGTGLDVVRQVRAHPIWDHTPILILASDVDPRTVGRAYALGANSYVGTLGRGSRSLHDVVKALYDHWLRDVRFPTARSPDRTVRFFTRGVRNRRRRAAFFMRMAQQLGDRPSAEASFWLKRALSESNLANLIAFLLRQSHRLDLPIELLDEVEQAQEDAELRLESIEREIEERQIAMDDEACQRVFELVSISKVRPYARALSYLFPRQPLATAALVEFFCGDLDEVAEWIETHATDPAVRARSAQLREQAAYLRTLTDEAA